MWDTGFEGTTKSRTGFEDEQVNEATGMKSATGVMNVE